MHGYSPSTTKNYAVNNGHTFNSLGPVPVDKSDLAAKLTEIEDEGLDEADYTDASWSTLQDALTAAELVLADDDATQDDVDDSLGILTTAYDSLKDVDDPVVPADKSDLEAKLTEIDDAGLAEADYIDASWDTLQDALSAAQSVIDDDDATQDDVDDSLGTLTTAYDSLKDADDPVVPADKSDLEAKLTEIDDAGLAEADYIDASWDTLQDALSAAQSVIDDDDATQDEVNDSLATLIAAYDGLEDADDPRSPESDFEWSDNGDGTVTITGYTGSDTDLTIPAQLDEKNVTKIGDSAFAITNLSSVVIPEGVTEIGKFAFAENNLTSVKIPESVTEIGYGAFAHNNLTSIVIPEKVTKIGGTAFLFNNLTGTVVIPESVTEIGGGAFGDNPLLSDAMIYNPEVEIDGDPFADLHGNPSDTIIHGYRSSTAEEFTNEFNYTFKPFDEDDPTDPEGNGEKNEVIDDNSTSSEDPSDEEKSNDSVIVVGEQVDFYDDSDKEELSVEISDEDGTKLPMTATSFYTLIFGGLLLIIFGIATFIIFRVRQRKN